MGVPCRIQPATTPQTQCRSRCHSATTDSTSPTRSRTSPPVHASRTLEQRQRTRHRGGARSRGQNSTQSPPPPPPRRPSEGRWPPARRHRTRRRGGRRAEANLFQRSTTASTTMALQETKPYYLHTERTTPGFPYPPVAGATGGGKGNPRRRRRNEGTTRTPPFSPLRTVAREEGTRKGTSPIPKYKSLWRFHYEPHTEQNE